MDKNVKISQKSAQPTEVRPTEKQRVEKATTETSSKISQQAKVKVSEKPLLSRNISKDINDVFHALAKFAETMGYKFIAEFAPGSTAKIVAVKYLAKETTDPRQLERYMKSLENLAPWATKEDAARIVDFLTLKKEAAGQSKFMLDEFSTKALESALKTFQAIAEKKLINKEQAQKAAVTVTAQMDRKDISLLRELADLVLDLLNGIVNIATEDELL